MRRLVSKTWAKRGTFIPWWKLNEFLKPKTMQVDLTLSNARVYNIDTIDIKVGEHFFLTTNGDGTEDLFSDNDQVLDIVTSGKGASLTAAEVGTSKLRWMNVAGNAVIKQVTINVMSEILPPASDLNLTSDTPILK